MLKRILYFTLLIMISAQSLPANAASDSLYTNATGTLSINDRDQIGMYLSRFGACYTADSASSSTHRYVFTDGWTDEMSKIKNKIRTGKIRVNGDYAVVIGSPYEMLLETVGKFKEVESHTLQG
ncbi:MAG: hypothetical protein RSC29_02055, partial [Oscillospiraceae bacterium]